jgi:DnaJ-class molecular chaperone
MSMKTCPACQGSTNCPSCRGSGTKVNPKFLSLNNVTCNKCGGSGNCTRCKGRGVVPAR